MPTDSKIDNRKSSQQENINQNEQLYGTIKKSPYQDHPPFDRIPEYSEDIYPYATFQVNNQQQNRSRHQPPSIYNNYQPIPYKEAFRQPGPKNIDPYGKVGVRGRHPTPCPRSIKSESEEYDTYGSDSETEQPISSRTESSNQLDHDRPHLPHHRI